MNKTLTEFKASKDGRILLSHLISLLKGIYFIDKAKTIEEVESQIKDGFVSSSNYGIGISHPYCLSLNVGWKRKSLEFLELIADKFILNLDELSYGDRETFCKTIRNTIQNSLLDTRIFDISRQNSENVTFFSILSSNNLIPCVDYLVDLIYFDLLNTMADWLIIFPLPRIKSKSYSLIFDGITLIDPNDTLIWKQLAPNFRGADSWYPSSQTNNSKWDAPDSTWLVCQSNGTADGTRRIGGKKMRTFLSVLFAFLYPTYNLLDKSSGIGNTYCVQFSSVNGKVRETNVNASIGNILHPLITNVDVTEQNLQDVSKWYKKRANFNEEKKKRITTASQFLNYAIVTGGIDRFIHFFIVLDALFGKRGDVERLITEGIKSTFPTEPMWEYKISRLFDLRSELVHGGCSSISEWKDLDSYRRHTKSHPSQDVITAAITAFKNI